MNESMERAIASLVRKVDMYASELGVQASTILDHAIDVLRNQNKSPLTPSPTKAAV